MSLKYLKILYDILNVSSNEKSTSCVPLVTSDGLMMMMMADMLMMIVFIIGIGMILNKNNSNFFNKCFKTDFILPKIETMITIGIKSMMAPGLNL